LPLPIIRSVTESELLTSSTSFTVNMPPSRPDGRLYVMLIHADGGDEIADEPGWTRIQRSTSGSTTAFWVGYRIGSSEPASYSVNTVASASETWHAIVLGIDRFDASAPIDVSSVNTGTSAAPTPTGVTTTVDDCLVLWCMAHDSSSASQTAAPTHPSGYGPITVVRTSIANGVLHVHYTTKAAAGSVSGDAGNLTSSDEWIAALIAIAGDPDVPEITGVTADEERWIADGETGVVLAGSGFEASKGSGKLELWDDSVGTDKVEQTTSAWSDTSITFTADRDTIAQGRIYAVVTTNGGLVSEPFRVVVLDAAPDVKVAQVRVSANTSAGDQDITTSDLGGVTPKAVHFRIIRATADGSADHVSFGEGMATSSTARAAIAYASEDGVGTTETFVEIDDANCIILIDPLAVSHTLECVADFVSFLADGCRINWSVSAASGYQIVATFFAGSQLQAHVSPVVVEATFSGSSAVFRQQITTGIGDPDLLIAFSAQTLSSFTLSGSTSGISWGASHLTQFEDLRTLEQNACVRYRISDAVTTASQVVDAFDAGFLIASSTTGHVRAAKSYIDRDIGYSLYPVIQATFTRAVGILELIMPGVGAWVGAIDPRTSAGSQSITAPGFRPQWATVVQTMVDTLGTGETTDDANSITLASFTATDEQAIGMSGDDGASGSNCISYIDDAAINHQDVVAGALFTGSFTSFDSVGWTWNFSAANGTQRRWLAWAIEGFDAGTITLTPSALALPISLPSPVVTRDQAISPAAQSIPLALLDPVIAHALALAPAAVSLGLDLPAPAVAHDLELSPAAQAIPLDLPAPALSAAMGLAPSPLALGLEAPAPAVSSELSLAPAATAIPIALPAPGVSRTLTLAPAAAAVPFVLPDPAVYVGATTTCTESAYGADVRIDGLKGHLDGDDFAGTDGSGNAWRWALKFPVSGISGTVIRVELVVTVAVVVGTPTTWDIGPYGTNGQDDPNADTGATMFSRCANAGEYANDTNVFGTTGSKTINLGAQAVADLQAAIAGGSFSVSCRYNGAGTGVGGALQEYDPIGTTAGEPELCVTTAAGAISITPIPVAIGLAAPAPTLSSTLALAPSPVAVPLAAPAPAVSLELTLAPGATSLPIALPAPAVALSLVLSPAAASIPVALPAPSVSVAGTTTLQPDALAVGLAAPAPAVQLVLSLAPTPLAVELAAPAPTLAAALALSPSSTAIPLALPAPSVAQDGGPITLSPDALAVGIAAPAPTVALSLTISPEAAALALGLPMPALLAALALTPAAQALALSAPAPALQSALSLTPGAQAVPLALPAPALSLALTIAPGPLGLVLSAPAPLIAQVQLLSPLPLVLALSAPAPEILLALASTLTEAIFDVLSADDELVALLASYDPAGAGAAVPAIFTDPVPETAQAPFIVLTGEISQEPELDDNGGSLGRAVVFDVRFYAPETGSKQLFNAIARRIRRVLHRQELRLAGRTWLDSRARGPIPNDAEDLHGAVISLRVLLDG
jgi:hypothetical protein